MKHKVGDVVMAWPPLTPKDMLFITSPEVICGIIDQIIDGYANKIGGHYIKVKYYDAKGQRINRYFGEGRVASIISEHMRHKVLLEFSGNHIEVEQNEFSI